MADVLVAECDTGFQIWVEVLYQGPDIASLRICLTRTCAFQNIWRKVPVLALDKVLVAIPIYG